MVTTDDSALFVDTNILVYISDESSSWHEVATRAISAARDAGNLLVISP